MKAGPVPAEHPNNDQAFPWLLEENQPAVRYRALVDLLGGRESDPEVELARSQIARTGWARGQLGLQGPKGYWEPRGPKNVQEWVIFRYVPTELAMSWRAPVLSDSGLDATNSRIKKNADLLFECKLRLSSPFSFFYEEMGISANTTRMLTRFGYVEDSRVRKLYDWLIEDQQEDGGELFPRNPGEPRRLGAPRRLRRVTGGQEFPPDGAGGLEGS